MYSTNRLSNINEYSNEHNQSDEQDEEERYYTAIKALQSKQNDVEKASAAQNVSAHKGSILKKSGSYEVKRGDESAE
jgi:hypothetical protein